MTQPPTGPLGASETLIVNPSRYYPPDRRTLRVHVVAEALSFGYITRCGKRMRSANPVHPHYDGGVTCRVCASLSAAKPPTGRSLDG